VTHPIIADELAMLQQVTNLLNEVPTVTGPSETAVVEELTRLREMMREEVKVEDQAALMEQWNRQSALLDQLRASRQAPQVDRNSPYFAHLRLRENRTERDILLGKATRLQRGVRIVDWRNAPISRIFYRYQQGDEYEEDIAGRTMTGTVVTRRTVWAHTPVEPPRLAGGEGAALRAYQTGEGVHRRLGTDLEGSRRRADKHLPDIAGLIDPQQFALITRPSAGFVVIRGTAGSGKTTVALHRIAYLAYDDASIDSAQTLVVVFSPALRDYVSHVLPALGVEHVQVRTFYQWAAEHVARLFPRLPRHVREDTPALVQRLKLHPGVLVALAKQVSSIEGRPTARQVLDDWASVLCQAALLEEVFAAVAPSGTRS
jgi:DNA helicase-2/ATP-dependent DNA helicase PcrA